VSYSFCFGPSGSGKSQRLREILIGKAQASLACGGNDRTKYILVVPEQYSMQTQRELVQDHPARVLMNIDVLSFGRLAYRVFEETGADRRTVLDDIGKSLLLRRVAAGCEKDLQVLHRGIRRTGMIDEIKSVLSEFMQYGIDEAQIGQMADYAGSCGQRALQARLLDMKVLLRGFREAETDRYITSEQTMDLLAKAIPKAESLRGSVVIFDGFTGFSTVQYRVLIELIRCAKEVVFSLTAGFDSGPDMQEVAAGSLPGDQEALFYLSRRTVFDIIRLASGEKLKRGKDIYLPGASVLVSPAVLPRYGQNRVLSHLERHLFRYPLVPFSEKKTGETGSVLRLFAATTPQEEVRQIFSQIHRMIAQTGCAWRDFAIITADLAAYGDLIEAEASRYEVPVYIDRTSAVFHNILIEGIRSVLQISSENFSYASVFRYLRSGLSRLTLQETDILENYCIARGIRGRKKWAAPFDADCEEARIKFLREIQPVTGLGDSGDDLPRRARTAAVRTRELYAFLESCGAQGRMDSLADQFDAGGDVVRQKQYSQIYRAVIDLLDRIYDLAGEERMGARDYLELLEAGFTQIRLGTLPQRVDRVLVGDMERTRLTQVRHLFFAGANDGNIPRSASRGGILSDMDREFLAAGGAALAPTPRQQMFTQRLYLYLNMTKPSDTLTVSFAKTSQEGKSLRPSYLIAMLRSLFPQLKATFPEAEPPAGRIFGRADGMRLLADRLRVFAETGGGFAPAPDPAFYRDFTLLYGFFTSLEVEAADPSIRQAAETLRKAALYRYRPQILSPETALAVYGKTITGGISRMETAAKCLLCQHLQYGLRLKERETYEFAYADSGSLLHAALQKFDLLLQEASISWKDFSAEDARRFAHKALREEAAQYRNLLLYKSARDESRLARFEKSLLRTVDTLQYQIRQGDLMPVAAELQFGDFGPERGHLPAIRYDLEKGRNLYLVGKIDRFDMYAEKERRFIRLTDYKTGKKELDIDLIRRGLQLQLITYMEALREAGPARLDMIAAKRGGAAAFSGKGLPAGSPAEAVSLTTRSAEGGLPAAEDSGTDLLGKQAGIIPSAMLFYRIFEPVIEAAPVTDRLSPQEEDELTAAVRRQLRPTGLCLLDEESIAHLDRFFEEQSDVIPVKRKKAGGYAAGSRLLDPAQYQELAGAAREAVCRVANQILDGEITAAPAQIGTGRNACDYCPFKDACGFDLRIPGYVRRRD